MNALMLAGLNEIIQGIIMPICISFIASMVRAALFGWYGFRHYFANLTVGIFGGLIAHWVCAYYSCPSTIEAVIISVSSLISYDAMKAIFSRRSMTFVGEAVRKRLEREILTRGAPNKEHDE